MATNNPELDDFLGRVDQIDSIVRGLSSKDEKTTKGAMSEADQFLDKFGDLPKQIVASGGKRSPKYPPRDNTGINRSVINQKGFDNFHKPQQAPGTNDDSQMDQDAFMRIMEQDVQERYERRKAAEKEAIKFKEQGNEEFKLGNYQKAVNLYVEASTHFKDMTSLWTNLAQAYNKLSQYEKALDACDWAFRTFENSLKACVHQGKAYLGLKEYDKALESYDKALQINPKKENIIRGYMQDVELARRAGEEEASAQDLFNSGAIEATGLVDLMQRVNKQGELPLFYSGGLRLTREALTNVEERTLFRTNGGLLLTRDHQLIAKCFAASPRSLSREELDMCASTIDTFQAACTDCEHSQKILFEVPELPDQLIRFMETKVKFGKWVKGSVVNLLHQTSITELGRSTLVSVFDIPRLLTAVFSLMKVKGVVGLNAVSFLNNLALDKRFKAKLRGNIEEDVLPAFEALMKGEAGNQAVLPSCISTMTNLCGDPIIRQKITERDETWLVCNDILATYFDRIDTGLGEEILYTVLGFLMNMTFNVSDNAKKHSNEICLQCHKLLNCGKANLEQRSCGVMSHLLPHCQETSNLLCEKDVVPLLLELLKRQEQDLSKPAMKCLSACTQFNQDARSQIADYPKGLKAVVDGLKTNEEVIIGNAALSLGHCAEIPKVCKALAKTEIIKELLVLARDGQKKNLQHNCAILIAKLAQGNQQHLERLRELDGMGILHQVLQKVEK